MFNLVPNTPFIYNANQFTGFYLTQIFTENFLSKQAIEIWSLILIIPIIHAKNVYTKYEKICIFEKIHSKIIIVKRNLNNMGFFY